MNSFTGSMLAVCFGEQLAAAAAEEISPNKHITDYDERWESSNLEHRRRRRRRCPSERSSRVSSSLLKLLLFFCAFLSSFFPQHTFIPIYHGQLQQQRNSPISSSLYECTLRGCLFICEKFKRRDLSFRSTQACADCSRRRKKIAFTTSHEISTSVWWLLDGLIMMMRKCILCIHHSTRLIFFREREATTMTFVTFWGFLFSASAEHH